MSLDAEESKVDALKATCVFVALMIVLVTAPTWGPLIDEATEPKTIVVMDCARGH